jgi:hypothetical protein
VSVYRFTQVACDGEGGCHRELTDAGGAAGIRRELKRSGWLVGYYGKDYCPKHRPDEQRQAGGAG